MNKENSLKEINDFFIELSTRKEITYNAFSHIQEQANNALQRKDYDQLLSLITYMEISDGHYALQYIGEARRIFRILNIISLEKKFGKTLFCYDCDSLNALMEKYVLVLFALRRIIFHLSDESVDNALTFLYHKNLTPFAIYIFTKDELIIPTPELYETILTMYEDSWTKEDIEQYLALVNSVTN